MTHIESNNNKCQKENKVFAIYDYLDGTEQKPHLFFCCKIFSKTKMYASAELLTFLCIFKLIVIIHRKPMHSICTRFSWEIANHH